VSHQGIRFAKFSFVAFSFAPLLTGCGAGDLPAPEPPLVEVVVVPGLSAPWQGALPGRAVATEEVDLGFEVEGYMVERSADVGDEVNKGQLLASLDTRDFENELAQAKAARDRASVRLDRVRQAARTGAVSQQDLTDAEAQYEAAEAITRTRTKALQDTSLVAPFKGTVAATYIEGFQQVQRRQPILRLLDTSRIEMWIDLPETAIDTVEHVEAVWVRFDVLPGRRFQAQIKEVGREADSATRTYPVNLIIDQPEDVTILPGMAGEASAELAAQAVAERIGSEVPLGAIYSDGTGATFAWVVDLEALTVSRREIETGGLTDRGILVQEGLTSGEMIVVQGPRLLREGSSVRLVESGGGGS
jgi:RND family efflux transporter MFP subunit